MQLKKSSLFYKFLTMFDPSVLYECYDAENGEWGESADSCKVFALLIANTFVCLVIALGLFVFVGSIGLTLGWIAAMIHSFSYIVPGAWEFATATLSLILALGYMVFKVTDNLKHNSFVDVCAEVVKSKLSKTCVKIDIVD